MVDIVVMPTGIGQRISCASPRRLEQSGRVCTLEEDELGHLPIPTREGILLVWMHLGRVVADQGELDSDEAMEFLMKHGVRLTLTTTYNPEANGKIECRNGLIVKALVNSCNGNVKIWVQLLAYALWADRTMHSSMTGYMPLELMTGLMPIIPTVSCHCKLRAWVGS